MYIEIKRNPAIYITGFQKAGGSNPELTRRGAMIELLEDLPFRQILHV
jgi:hypothetical protein